MSPTARGYTTDVDLPPNTVAAAPAGQTPRRARSWLRLAVSGAGLLLLPAALWILHHELRKYQYHELADAIRGLPRAGVLLAIGLTVVNYVVLASYDLLGLRFVRRPLPVHKAMLAAVAGFAISNSIGLFLVSAGLIRLGLYSNWGLSAAEVAGVVTFNSITFHLGLFTVGGLMLAGAPLPESLPLPVPLLRLLGVLLLALVAAYFLMSLRHRRFVEIRRLRIPIPSLGLALGQLAISITDWVLSAAVIYVLLPADVAVPFATFFGIFVLAQLAGILSQVPGGLGVFETALVLLLRRLCPTDQLVGTLLVYRAIFYLLPLAAAALLLGAYELGRRRERVRRVSQAFAEWMPFVAPPLLTTLTFASGVLLLFSGATPALQERLRLVARVLPLAGIEAAHFLASLLGVGLLLVARGLAARLRGAYHLALLLVGLGIALSLLKGLDYEEALALAALLAALLPCRRYFHRHLALAEEPFTAGWVYAVGISLAATGWLSFFAYKHVTYHHALWWQASLAGDAPRSLRAMAGAAALGLGLGLFHLLRRPRPRPAPPGPADLEQAAALTRATGPCYGYLALLGDKSLLFSPRRDAFLMYGVSGRHWVAMGDPLGAPDAAAELAWSFRELCDRHRGFCVFYEASPGRIPLYLDLGLIPLKIGEEARVPLATFNLDGPEHKPLRHAVHHVEKGGATLEIVAVADVSPLLPACRQVSDAWLQARNTRERGFSLGSFRPDYLRRFPLAVVRHQGRLVAFASLWLTDTREELATSLVRYHPDAPHGTMDFLFARLMLWGQAQGCRTFNLGVVPLEGLEDRSVAPLWHRLGTMAYRHGEPAAGLDGLRQFRDKFGPAWEPRYLLYPAHLQLPQVLLSVASLIAGSAHSTDGRGQDQGAERCA